MEKVRYPNHSHGLTFAETLRNLTANSYQYQFVCNGFKAVLSVRVRGASPDRISNKHLASEVCVLGEILSGLMISWPTLAPRSNGIYSSNEHGKKILIWTVGFYKNDVKTNEL